MQRLTSAFRLVMMLVITGLLLAGTPAGVQPRGSTVSSSFAPPMYLPMMTAAGTSAPVPSAEACKLPEAANLGNIGLGFPPYPNRADSTGTVRVMVIFVDFSDAQATRTPQEVFHTLSPGASDFFRTNSYGRLDYQLTPHLTWLRMSKPSTGYGWSGWSSLTYALQLAYIQEAVSLADSQVDFRNFDLVAVIANPDASAISYGPAFTGDPMWGGYSADGVTFYNGLTSGADLLYFGPLWMNHEAGHTMGLVDFYAHVGDTHRFVGGFDVMGQIVGSAPEQMAYPRWLMGWLDDNQIFCQQTPSETVFLSAIERVGGVKAVMVPTGPNALVVVESRRALGYDAGLVKTGALVYTIDSSIASGNGPVQVLPNQADKYQSLLLPGQQLTVGAVTIEVLAATSDGDTVRVTVAQD